MTLEFKKLSSADLPDFYDIRFSVTENTPHPNQIQYLLREAALSDIQQGGGWLCIVDGIKVGFSMGVFIPDALIAGLFVRPEFHGNGIGKKLLNFATDWLFNNGAQQVKLTTEPESFANKFYIKQGWDCIGLDEFGSNIFTMTKEKWNV